MISINLLRISPDSKYLEFSIECPINYLFNKLYIKKYDYVPIPTPVDINGNPTDDGWRDISHLLQRTSTKEVMRISTLALTPELTIEPDSSGNSASTMFYVQFGVALNITGANYKAQWLVGTTYAANDIVLNAGNYYNSLVSGNVGNPTTDTAKWAIAESIPDVMGVCSDVNKVYTLLKDHILNLDANCISQEDYQSLLRNYMFLYAHTEAMRLERFDEAEMYYDIIKKSFGSCIGHIGRYNSTRKLNINTCNCS